MLKLARQLGQKTGQFLFGWLLFILRGHVTRIKRIKNVLPMGGYGIVGQLQGHFIQAKLALLFLRPMATETVFGEEGFDRFFR